MKAESDHPLPPSQWTVEKNISIEKKNALPDNWGRFHATWKEIKIDSTAYRDYPRFGKSTKPFLVRLDVHNCRGKYVGNMLHVAWPYPTWWGEGDWLIWSDENVYVYSFHMNDHFQFQNNLRVAVEVWWHKDIMRSIYGSTAFWYAYPVQDANSQKTLLSPRLKHDLTTDAFIWE